MIRILGTRGGIAAALALLAVTADAGGAAKKLGLLAVVGGGAFGPRIQARFGQKQGEGTAPPP